MWAIAAATVRECRRSMNDQAVKPSKISLISAGFFLICGFLAQGSDGMYSAQQKLFVMGTACLVLSGLLKVLKL